MTICSHRIIDFYNIQMFVHIKVPAFLKDIFPQTLSVIRKT